MFQRCFVFMLLAAVMSGCGQSRNIAATTVSTNVVAATPSDVIQNEDMVVKPSSTPSPLPTLTPTAVDEIVPTPYPIPTAAPFPGDYRVTLEYEIPDEQQPRTVKFITTLTGGSDSSYELYCVPTIWHFGNGETMTSMPDCGPWTPDIRISRVLTADYTYTQPGRYTVYFQYEARPQPDLTPQSSPMLLTSNTITVTVR